MKTRVSLKYFVTDCSVSENKHNTLASPLSHGIRHQRKKGDIGPFHQLKNYENVYFVIVSLHSNKSTVFTP